MTGIGQQLSELLHRGGIAAMTAAAERILEASDRDIPKGDPAADPDPAVSIRESRFIDIEQGGRSLVAGYDAPYSAKQHEDQHLKHPRGGGPKFLEKNVLAMLPRLEGIVASEVRKQTSGRRR